MACQFVNDADAFAACLCHCKFTTQMCPKFSHVTAVEHVNRECNLGNSQHILVCMTLNDRQLPIVYM